MALLRGGGTVDALIEAGGREAWLAQYLRDEFLRDLPAEDARFLAVSGPLGDVSGAMCDAVLETHGSAETLRRLSQSNSLLFPLDQAGESYHVHRLLQEMLASDVARSDPDLILSVYARAGDWWDEQGEWQRAVRFARAAGDGDRAGALMIRHVPDYAFTAQSELGQLLDEVPAALTRMHPTLALARAWTSLPDPSNDETPMWAALAEQGLETGAGAPGEVDAQVALHLMRAVLAEQGCGAMAGHAAAARGLAHPAGPWAGLSCSTSRGPPRTWRETSITAPRGSRRHGVWVACFHRRCARSPRRSWR